MGFNLTHDEFLAIRFHMGLRNKKSHPLYTEALTNQLCFLVHKSDGRSASLGTGFGYERR